MKSQNKNNNSVSEYDAIIADFIVEEYRFCKAFISMINKLYSEERSKYESVLNFHYGKIQELSKRANVAIISFEGKPYDDGLPIKSLNIDDFSKEDSLMIEQTIEPTIISTDNPVRIIRYGSVILNKVAE